MALQKQILDIPLIGGLNQKVSSKNVAPPEVLTMRNGRFMKEGRVDKRYGYTNLGLTPSTGSINTPTSLESINDELLLFSADTIYSYSEHDGKWYDKGTIARASTELNSITSSVNNAQEVDAITKSGVKVVTWIDNSSTWYSVIDTNTNNVLIAKRLLVASTATHCRLVATSQSIFIIYAATASLKSVKIPLANAGAASFTTTTLYTDLDSSTYAFDADGLDSFYYIMYATTTSGTTRIAKISNDQTVVATNTLSSVTAVGPRSFAVHAISSTTLGRDVIYLSFRDGNDQNLTAYTVNLVQDFAPVTLATDAVLGSNDSSVVIMSGAVDQANITTAITFYSATDKNFYTKFYTIDADGQNQALVITVRSVGVASRGFEYNGIGYVTLLHESTLQPTYFIYTSDGRMIAKVAQGQGGTHATIGRPANFSRISAGLYHTAVLKKGRIQSDSERLFANTAPYTAVLNFTVAKNSPILENNRTALIPGGSLGVYDGKSVIEYGFEIYPEDVSLAETTGGSLPTTSGPYLVYAVYEWIDDKGNRYLSAPSVAETITLSGSNTRITVTIPTLRVTAKTEDNAAIPSRDTVNILVYMTTAGGTVPYKVATVANGDITADDTQSVNIDSAPAGTTEILYTTGGALENIAPVSHTYAFTHDNRIVIVGLDDPNQIRFSKDIKPLTGAGFNEDFSINLDPLGGKCVAGASMDSYMVIFKEAATFIIAGSGPNDLGEGSSFSAPQVISSDIGCKDIKSILTLPEGIIFKSNKGIYLLTRGLDLIPIGDKVSDYDDNTVLSADILKNSEEIRFVTDANITLVYNYYFKRWAVYDTPNALDATTWKTNKYVYLTSAKVMKEDSTTYLDDGSYVSTVIRTGWIHLAGMQGYQRLYRLGLLGTYHNNHIFSLKFYYDYSDIVKESTTITASDLVNTAVYGDSATYGADDYYGGSQNDEVYQTRHHLERQKCEAVSIEISDSIVGSNMGRGFSLEGVSLQIGKKRGLLKTSNTRST